MGDYEKSNSGLHSTAKICAIIFFQEWVRNSYKSEKRCTLAQSQCVFSSRTDLIKFENLFVWDGTKSSRTGAMGDVSIRERCLAQTSQAKVSQPSVKQSATSKSLNIR